MSRVLVVGSGGMLGLDLMAGLDRHDVTGMTRSQLDITHENAVLAALDGFDVVINAAAYTAVDAAEAEREQAFLVNAEGPQNLAKGARATGATLIHVSTDYVFDGDATAPYAEEAEPNPRSVYGASKWAGEQAVRNEYPEGSIIVRTSWLYGLHGNCFPRTILQAAQARDTLEVVDDQVGQPTWTKDVVGMIKVLINHHITNGIFHATNSGQTTWHGFATRLFELAGWDSSRVHPATTANFPRPAPRPAWSVLGHGNWIKHDLPTPRSWDAALDEAWGAGLSGWAVPAGDTP